jgi:hypothetical protein
MHPDNHERTGLIKNNLDRRKRFLLTAQMNSRSPAGEFLDDRLMFTICFAVNSPKYTEKECEHALFAEDVGVGLLRFHRYAQGKLRLLPHQYLITAVHRCLRDKLKDGWPVKTRMLVDDWRVANPENINVKALPKNPTKRSDKTERMFDDEAIKEQSKAALELKETTGGATCV